VATVTNAKGTMEYFFGTDHYDSHFRGAVLAANAATSDVELKLCWPIDFGTNDGVTFDNTHQVTVGAVTRPVAITLNLDIFTLSGAGTEVIWNNEGTSLTITNTGDPGGVPIPGGYSSTNAAVVANGSNAIGNVGTLTITGGKILCNSSHGDHGIYNCGIVYFKGGSISSFSIGIENENDGIVYVSGGTIDAVNAGIRSNPCGRSPQIYVSGGKISGIIYGIENLGGAVTISGGTIEAGSEAENISGTAIYSDGSLTFEALPTFNVVGTGSNDIYLSKDGIITFGSNFAVGSTFDKLKVCIDESNGPDYTFTNGYSTRVKYAAGTDKAGQVIPPAEFFDAYYDNNNVALSSDLRLTDGGEAELFEPLYSYVDATGTLHENVQAIVLNGSETSIGYRRTIPGSSESIEAMYICTTPASENNGQGLVYGDYLDLRDNVPLIIADGCKLTAPGIRNLVSGKTLTIYTQSGQTGQIVAATYSCNVSLAQRFVAYAPGATESDPMIATAIVSGNVTDLSAIAGKTLKPLGGYIVAVADGISLMDGTTAKTPDFTITTGAGTESEVTTPYYIYQASTEQNPVTVTLSYGGTDFVTVGGLPEGTTLNAVENQPMQRNFAMPAEDVALTTTAVTSFSVSGYYTYSGSAQTPSIKYGDNVIMNADDDFIVTGITKGGTTVTDAIDAGDYSLTIAGVGSYMGTASGIAFSINKKRVYNNSSTLIVDDAIYNGGIVVPEIELKDDNNNVIASSEYTVNIVPYDLFNQGIDYGNSSSIGSVMDVGIYYAVLYGKEESNYDVGVSSAFTVRKKPVGIRWSTDALVYDGTAKAPTASATGVEDVDAGKVSVTVSVDGEHSDAGNYTATASALSGNRASNYRLPTSSETGYATLTNAFAISPKPVTVISTGVTADNKIYDGTTSATLSGSFAFDDGMIIDGDDVTITGGTGAFADKNVGIGKAVVISGVTLGGMDAGNYTLSAQPTGITGSITKKTVTVSGITASNKAYDGKTMATLNYNSTTISGKVTGDKLSVSATGAFADKNAGNNKTVTISNITLTGSDKDNYTLATTGATTTANISKKALTVTADDKSVSYGDAAPTYTASYSGFVSGESKNNLSGSLGFSCSYTSSSATGTYSITPSGYTSSNYSISYAAGTLTVGAKNVAYSGGTVTKDEDGYTVSLDEGDGSANPLPDGADLDNLTYSRTLTAPGTEEGSGDVEIGDMPANLYTLCVPFAPETGTDIKYYTLSGVSGETVSFEEVTMPAANTPYLIAVTGSTNIIESCTGEDVASMEINSTTVGGYTFTGTFTGMTNAEAQGRYILQAGNQWGKVVSGIVYIPPFRAYIEGPASGARMLTGRFDDDATGLQYIRTTDADGTEQWYDLNGRRISKPTQKGMYIHNGRKDVMK
jgi:hypothetical protein